MTDGLRVAIVGCGIVARVHAEAIRAIPGACVVALVAPSLPSAENLASTMAEAGDPMPLVFRTLGEALAGCLIDLVAVTTPTGFHVEVGLEALAAGKHVVIEKPLDVDLGRARRLETAASRAAECGIVSSVISQHRFDPASLAVASAVSNGRFGRLASSVASIPWWRSQGYYDSSDWRGTWAADGGGALMNQGIHTVDLLVSLMGRPVEISSRTGLLVHRGIEVEDTAVATISFEGGGLGVLHATTAAYPGLPTRLQIMGSEGSAVIENDRLAYFHSSDKGSVVPGMGLAGQQNQSSDELARFAPDIHEDSQPIMYASGHIRQYRDIVQAIEDGRPPLVTVGNAVRSLATVRAVYISATLNEPVLFKDVLAEKYSEVNTRTGAPEEEEEEVTRPGRF